MNTVQYLCDFKRDTVNGTIAARRKGARVRLPAGWANKFDVVNKLGVLFGLGCFARTSMAADGQQIELCTAERDNIMGAYKGLIGARVPYDACIKFFDAIEGYGSCLERHGLPGLPKNYFTAFEKEKFCQNFPSIPQQPTQPLPPGGVRPSSTGETVN